MIQEVPLILGLGKTGFSVATYFKSKKINFRVIDTRIEPPQLSLFKKEFPNTPIHLGSLNTIWLKETNKIIVSPGLDLKDIIIKAKCSPTKLYSDIDLFNQEAQAPIIAITGSNGKSTTTALVAHLITHANKRAYIGGNFGIPALDLLKKPTPDFYVLELSSFQLTLIQNLKLHIGVFLNLNEDHMDRHGTINHYCAMKQKIFRNCKIGLWNRDYLATAPIYPLVHRIDFGSSMPLFPYQWGLIKNTKTTWLAQGNQKIINTKSLTILGKYNALNALAALAVYKSLKLPLKNIVESCANFKSLAHRCEKIIQNNNITWINDSKSTNVNATISAILSLSVHSTGKFILIIGGVNKNKNLNSLTALVKKHVKHLILIGQDASQFKQVFQNIVDITQAQDLKHTVEIASNYAQPNDIVLLSPACASFDMFTNYIERGETFKKEVNDFLFYRKNI